MAKNSNRVHVSPGVYSSETELTYAVKSLGITTLGVVGETLKGPAFQPMLIENWREFQSMFGGTSAEKFKGSQYPKYELPYIAKSYLTESKQLQVCRVLGLSGYNAGPAWAITASKGVVDGVQSDKMVVAVLRARGHYEKVRKLEETDDCSCPTELYDSLVYSVGEKNNKMTCTTPKSYEESAVTISEYTDFNTDSTDCSETKFGNGTSAGWSVNEYNKGKFIIVCGEHKYSVTLNPGDKNYILKVLGTNPSDGDALVYVEALYDVALEFGIEDGTITQIDKELEFYQVYNVSDYCALAPVNGLKTKEPEELTRKDVNKRFLDSETGEIYTVTQKSTNGKRTYEYTTNENDVLTQYTSRETSSNKQCLVLNKEDGRYYRLGTEGLVAISCDLNNYRDSYRFASTPWFVSNVKGDMDNIQLNKLFRFHTISDGDASNNEVKVSIQNIKTDDGTFDVVIRDINDTDESVVVLEKFTKCTMVPGDDNYIAYKIGSYDGIYELKSKYVTVEVNENLTTRNSVPCGFLGYPLGNFGGADLFETHNVKNPTLKYNVNYDEDVKHRRQYFGLSNIVGVDIDSFTYKGNAAYHEEIGEYLCNGFHLDSRLSASSATTITVDGESGYTFDVVRPSNTTQLFQNVPVIGTEADMIGTIYENVDLRKFTCYFYGGFDGWDVYRDYRSNTDDFKMSNYRGIFNKANGKGLTFNKIENADALNLNQQGFTSDFYAYLSAIRQFANPEDVDINVFATPGIDLINNKLLCEEVIEMIEEERADSIYVATLPDKPFGNSDFVDDMYSSSDIVYELEDTGIDSNYTCTYYPWVKYEDTTNNQYIYLPPTKDVVRNMALCDNVAHPWFVPAGLSRGDVQCQRAKVVTKLADEDTLYEGRINPIKTFAVDGVKIWGQKNLQVAESQLNRIAVRRLLLRMRKLISIACNTLIFEPNDSSTKNTFLSLVTPILENIKANRGISDYRIEVEDTVESRMRRELNCVIYFKPTNALEFINLAFVVTPEAVSFDNI